MTTLSADARLTIRNSPIRIAALIAVEREAANRYRDAVERRRTVVLTFGTKCDEYTTASADDDTAMRAMVRAQADVDEALASLSYPGGEVMPLA